MGKVLIAANQKGTQNEPAAIGINRKAVIPSDVKIGTPAGEVSKIIEGHSFRLYRAEVGDNTLQTEQDAEVILS